MKIYSLFADGPHRAKIGIFTSKEKANKAWRLWTDAFRGTIWYEAKKILMVEIADTYLPNKKV